jgi:hypothetical protein
VQQERKRRLELASSYARQVKEMYWPKVSEAKKLELEHLKLQLKSQSIRRSQVDLKAAENRKHNNNIHQQLQSLRTGRGASAAAHGSAGAQLDTSREEYDPAAVTNQTVIEEGHPGAVKRKINWKKMKNSMVPTPSKVRQTS